MRGKNGILLVLTGFSLALESASAVAGTPPAHSPASAGPPETSRLASRPGFASSLSHGQAGGHAGNPKGRPHPALHPPACWHSRTLKSCLLAGPDSRQPCSFRWQSFQPNPCRQAGSDGQDRLSQIDSPASVRTSARSRSAQEKASITPNVLALEAAVQAAIACLAISIAL